MTTTKVGSVRPWKKYPAYRPNGMPWLGDLPSHWMLKPLCRLVTQFGGMTPNKEHAEFWSGSIPWVSPKDMKRWEIEDSEDHISEEAIRTTGIRLVQANAVLIVVRGMILAKDFPVAVNRVPVTINQDMKALVPMAELEADYLAYLLRAIKEAFFGIIEESGHGTKCLRTELWKPILCSVPPLSEQRAITAFLDRETTRIDALIEKKERLIVLLEEKRQAVIRHVVIRGLDPSAPLKDSGIPWLGMVPEHWAVTKLYSVSRFVPGKPHEPFIDDDGAYVCVNSRFVSTEGGTRKYCSQNLSPGRVGDILMVMSDLPNGRALAKAFFVDTDEVYAVNQRVCIIRSKGPDSRFLYYQLDRSPGLLEYDDGYNQTHLPNSAFKKLAVALPPLTEQKSIAKFLEHQSSTSRSLAGAIRDGIARLQEYRTALISAAVTGQIDVRDEVPS